MKGSGRRKLDQRVFMEQVRECRDKGYLLSSKIGSGTFSKVYLAYAMHQSMKHNRKLASDLQGKRHTIVSRPTSSRGRGLQESCPNPKPYSGTSQLLWLPPNPACTLEAKAPAG
ncbi:PREDICTED: testis-specific serine/threonine-protein kinase 5-like [Hipposideros armiger]|uniref:Testis-specific serine/threonine-protein kinase 5-like n=1 Tax=Hipposideros armiger TaxID=186990 RepID=A0A8B7QCB1_HIPAR|nr:PREDICTED: testis-specific serine/threonine-protein kinase 5-like [Hipposideros armiger]